jgi:hypothetical protein
MPQLDRGPPQVRPDEKPGGRDSEIPELGNFATLDTPQHEDGY